MSMPNINCGNGHHHFPTSCLVIESTDYEVIPEHKQKPVCQKSFLKGNHETQYTNNNNSINDWQLVLQTSCLSS